MSRWLVVGLGNPGKQYADTRHNIGFMAIEALAKTFPTSPLHTSQWSHLSQATIQNQSVLLLQPQTYMNRSGFAVKETLSRYEISPTHLIVIYDDLDLEPGRLRIRMRGGDGGHKGLHSIIEQLECRDFVRLRLGIGRPHVETSTDTFQVRDDVVDYVLQPFHCDEQPVIADAIQRTVDATELIVNQQIQQAMNLYNRNTVHNASP